MEEEEKSKSLAKLKNKHEAMITDLEGKWGAQGLLDLGLLGHPPLEDQHGPRCQELGWQAGLSGPVASSHCPPDLGHSSRSL